jgi:hypothetical protein
MEIKRTPSFERQLKSLSKKHFPIEVLKPYLMVIVERNSAVLKHNLSIE